MNKWKIVWLPVWIKCDLLLEVVLYLVRVTICCEKAVLLAFRFCCFVFDVILSDCVHFPLNFSILGRIWNSIAWASYGMLGINGLALLSNEIF